MCVCVCGDGTGWTDGPLWLLTPASCCSAPLHLFSSFPFSPHLISFFFSLSSPALFTLRSFFLSFTFSPYLWKMHSEDHTVEKSRTRCAVFRISGGQWGLKLSAPMHYITKMQMIQNCIILLSILALLAWSHATVLKFDYIPTTFYFSTTTGDRIYAIEIINVHLWRLSFQTKQV